MHAMSANFFGFPAASKRAERANHRVASPRMSCKIPSVLWKRRRRGRILSARHRQDRRMLSVSVTANVLFWKTDTAANGWRFGA